LNGTGLKFLEKNKLVSVAFVQCAIGEAGMREIAKFPNITVLRLVHGSQLKDEDLQWILRLPKLQTLYIGDNEQLTGKSMDTISKVHTLTRLSLQGLRKIDNECVGKIAGMNSLRYLSLEKTGVRDTGLKQLSRLKNLVALNLASLDITDKQLDYLKLPNLQMLVLRKNKITAAGLKKLSAWPTLVLLDVRDCPNISREELNTIRYAFPHIKFVLNGTVVYQSVPEQPEDVLRYEPRAVPIN